MTLKLLNSTTFVHDKASSGTSFTVTIPSTGANSILICTSSGAATVACHLGSTGGTVFNKRTTSLSTYEVACQDLTDTAGGTTTIGIVLNAAENVEGVIYEFAASSLTFNSGLAHTTSGGVTDGTLGVGGNLSPAGRGVILQAYATTFTTSSTSGAKYRGVEPAGKSFLNTANYGSGGKHWAHHAISDVVAGTYTPMTSRVTTLFGSSTQGVAWLYDDATSNGSYTDWDNAVQKENARPGIAKGQWFFDRTTFAAGGIYGYTDQMSYAAGSTVNFKVNSGNAAFTVEIWRLGAYGHETIGARRVQAATAGSPAAQSAPTVDAYGGTVCAWSTTATWSIPSDAVPGFYQAVIRLTATPSTNYYPIIFMVKSTKPSSKNSKKIMVKSSEWTWQAYNVWGAQTDTGSGGFTGRSVYAINSINGGITTRAFAVSFNRPYSTGYENYKTFFFDTEFAFVFWLELCGYDVDYYSTTDIDKDTTIPSMYGTVVSNGHDEYWTSNVRDAFENARDSGSNLMFTGANVSLWHVRFDVAGGDTDRRKMFCYKDSLNTVGYDGTTKFDPVSYTGTWRDVRTVGGGVNNTSFRPENKLTGMLFLDTAGVPGTGGGSANLTMDSSVAAKPAWRNTAVAALTGASTFVLGPYETSFSLIGYEIDGVYPADSNTPLAPYRTMLSTQNLSTLTAMADSNGATYTGSGSFSGFGMMLWESTKSGALVFMSGMLRLPAPLAAYRLGKYATADPCSWDLQQFFLNLFCDFGHTPQVMPDSGSTIDGAAAYVNPSPKQPATAYGLAPLGGLLLSLLV